MRISLVLLHGHLDAEQQVVVQAVQRLIEICQLHFDNRHRPLHVAAEVALQHPQPLQGAPGALLWPT